MVDTVRFTEAQVVELRRRCRSGRIEYKDELVPALRLRVSPTGASWSVLKRIPGGPMARVLIGRADDVSATDARKQARVHVGELQQGRDPNEEKRARRARATREGLTLKEALDIYLAERDLRPATASTYERDLRVTFGDYFDKPLAALTPEVVRNRHRDRKNRPITAQARVSSKRARKRITASPARADGAVRALRAVVRYLVTTRNLDLPDPAGTIVATKSWANVKRRKRALLDDALAAFVRAVRAQPEDLPPNLSGTQRDLVLFILCTALRWQSAAGLRWSEIDLRARTVTIPADRMKGKVAHTLPLGPVMLAMLKARRAAARSAEYVFPGLKVDKPLGRLSARFTAALLDDEGEGFEWSPHDLRRTALTLLERMDVSAYALKRIAAHAETGDVTAGYLADDVSRLRAPMERLEAVALTGKAGGKVVPMRRAKA